MHTSENQIQFNTHTRRSCRPCHAIPTRLYEMSQVIYIIASSFKKMKKAGYILQMNASGVYRTVSKWVLLALNMYLRYA